MHPRIIVAGMALGVCRWPRRLFTWPRRLRGVVGLSSASGKRRRLSVPAKHDCGTVAGAVRRLPRRATVAERRGCRGHQSAARTGPCHAGSVVQPVLKALLSSHIRGNAHLIAHELLTRRARNAILYEEYAMVGQMLATPTAQPDTASDLRGRILRIRRLASALIDEEARRQLLAMAEELEARVTTLEDATDDIR